MQTNLETALSFIRFEQNLLSKNVSLRWSAHQKLEEPQGQTGTCEVSQIKLLRLAVVMTQFSFFFRNVYCLDFELANFTASHLFFFQVLISSDESEVVER